MCGIAGIAFAENSPTLTEIDKVRKLITNLLVEISSRGTSATGLAVMNDKGDIKVYKKPLPAREFVSRKYYREFLERTINSQARSILLHARAQTKGYKEFNENNHPVLFGDWVVVHNGMISNDDSLFTEYNLKKTAVVDTVAIPMICHMFSKGIEKNPTEVMQKIREGLKKVYGSFAFGAMSPRFPNEIFLIRKSNPVHYINDYELDLCVFASEPKMIKQALDRAGLKTRKDTQELEEGSVARITCCDNYTSISKLTKEIKSGFYPHASHYRGLF